MEADIAGVTVFLATFKGSLVFPSRGGNSSGMQMPRCVFKADTAAVFSLQV